jgi:hypothetical protein
VRAWASGVADDAIAPAVAVPRWMMQWWVKVLVIFAASRIVTTALLLYFASLQQSNAWTSASPGYFDFARIWDGHWYYIIAMTGYPAELPLTDNGLVGESAWAFMPAYPFLVRILMLVTGGDFGVVAVVVSAGFALGAALVFYKLMALVLPDSAALFSVVLFCVAPLSPILQVAYAESMHLFFLTLALYFLVQRRYALLFPIVLVMSLTRPSGLAFALALLMHVISRWFTRGTDLYTSAERILSVLLGLFSAFMGVAWLLIAAAATGSLTAYTDTEMAWRSAYGDFGDFVPFTAWFQGAEFWAQWWGVPVAALTLLLIAGVVVFFAFLFTPPVRRLGVDLRFWVASYALYLLAVFFPQSSTFRLLMPLFPLLGAFALPTSRVYRGGVVVLCLIGQWAWIQLGWRLDGYDWTPP